MIEAPQPSQQIQQEVGQNPGQTIGKLDNGQALNFQNVQNVILQPSGSSTYQTPASQIKKDVPHLLPYLANRKEQEAQLSEVLSNFLYQDLSSHLVCIIHGDESQCHYNFLERMRKLSLRKWLQLEPDQPIIHKYHLECPAKFKNSDDLLKQLKRNLAESILGNSYYCPEKINDVLSNYPNLVIIHTHLLTEHLLQEGCETLDKLLKFCQVLHQEITKQKLIIYICIQYKVKRQKSKNILITNWISNFLRVFFKKYRYQHINKKVRKYLQTLDLNCFQPLSVIVLPELTGVNKGDVENWVRSQETRDFVGEAMIEPLIQKVGEMFESWEERTSSDTIPMSYLAEELSQLVKSLIATQGESA